MTSTKAADRRGQKAREDLSKRLTKLVIEDVPLDSISANAYNPNRQSDHDFELLKASMRTDGFTQPIVVLRASREIVDGEHRWRAARELAPEMGWDTIPVVFVDMTPEQARVSTLRHNRARGSEDIELVAQILRDLETLGTLDWAQDQLLMGDVEIQRMLNDVPAPEALAGTEFSNAWVPEGTHHASSENGHDGYIRGAQAFEGMTQSAAERQRVAEKALAAAKTDEERQAALRDRDIHRVALTFTGEEARVVKQALGDRPAEKLLQLCRVEL